MNIERLAEEKYDLSNKPRAFVSMVYDLQLQYPIGGKHTIGNCHNSECKNPSVGGYLCAECVGKCIDFLFGNTGKSSKLHEAIKEYQKECLKLASEL